MNALKNSVTLIGHLGRDPESKTLENGRMFAKFGSFGVSRVSASPSRIISAVA